MHIKKLEICGFKSFVDRTVIHFDHDVIGVVGPNGCGKSNVVDAIRWVMGEQSAKALRGKGMADVIFSGSEARAAAGFAEVTITFDNSEPTAAQQLPLEYRDYPEIAVTRRIYRGDGSNDYFINNTAVRLRDVTELFLGTGVGRKAYSIVEQGKIGMIVSARPEDRRILIEEAAGITKYRHRRRQAESKMAATRQNLERVRDIVSEIERQIGSLRRQAAKAQRFLRYREELDDLLLWEASHKLLELIATTGVAQAQKSDSEEKVLSRRTAVATRDAEIEVMRQAAKVAEQTAERAQNLAFTSDNDVREQDGRIERARDRLDVLHERLDSAREEQEELRDKAAQIEGERQALTETLASIEEIREIEQGRVEAEAAKLETLRQDKERADALLSDVRSREAAARTSIARAEAELEGFAQRHQEMVSRHGRLEIELARLDGEKAGLSVRRHHLETRAGELVSRKHAMCDARDALRGELPELEGIVGRRRKEQEERHSKLNLRRSRLHALKEVAERMEGVGAGVRNLLATGDSSLKGLLADRIEVPAEHTAALAGLVGDRLQCVIVDDLDHALELLRGLATDRRGRATIISRRPEPSDSAPPQLDDPGVVGLMIDQLGFDAEDAGVVRALVGDAVLVASHDDAQRLRAQGLHCDLVTPDGTVFHVDGRVSGGADDALASGMIERKRELRELAAEVAGLEEAVASDDHEVAELRSRLVGLRQALDEAKSEAHQAEIEMVTGEQDLQRLDQRLTLVTKRRAEVHAEVAEVTRGLVAGDEVRAQTSLGLQTAQQQQGDLAAGLGEAQEVAARCQEQLAHQQASHTERMVQLASVSERVAAAKAALSRAERDLSDLGERIDGLENERDTAAVEAGQVAASMMAARGQLIDAKHRAREAHTAFENARLGLDDARHSLALREAELREMRAALDEVAAMLQEREMKLQRLLLAREHLEEQVRERFRGLELRTVVGDFHARAPVGEEQTGRIRHLSEQIDRMGSVNLDAMSEYEEASKRYTYYTENRDDLESALADLEKAIAQMNRESKRLFKYAFEGINRRFIEIFPKMFRGGRAELRLTNPEDMLETGIEILAQPPGKRLNNIELMSGGEKAFTAVSLLLALFRFKPSPFCILDEVDAPLDDANIDRYAEAVRAMTDRSQFIVITHSKRTMQTVDVLYGVTMQEPGVSKLVGVRVADRTARSRRRTPMDATVEGAAQVVEQDDASAVA